MANTIGTVLGENKRRVNDTIEQLGTVNTATYFENYFEPITVREINIQVDTSQVTGTSLVLGHPTYGFLGSFYLGNIGEVMIWGHETYGIWNSMPWGVISRVPNRIFESQHYKNFIIDFGSTEYEATSSTAAGWGTGSLLLSSGGIAGGLLNSESFETGFGGWLNVTGDQQNWTRQTGATTSTGTGPSFATDGSYYVYYETSGPATGDEAWLEYDLGENKTGYVDFDYHMYGATMGSLRLEGWDGVTWTEIWSRSGDQGNTWYGATTPATDFTNYSKLRFVGIRSTSYTSDMALDNINIYVTGTLHVMETTNLVSDLDIQMSSTKFDRFQFNPTGSYANFMSGSYSTTAGSSWVGLNPYEETQLVVPGSDIRFKAVNNYGSDIVLDEVQFIIKQDDF